MMTRRQLLKTGSGVMVLSALPLSAFATEEDVQAAVKEAFGDGPLQEGKVNLKLPPIAENGYSVSMDVSVDSPMTLNNHVTQIGIFAPRNPIPTLARFHLTPQSGRARVATRIRMAGTQRILAVAQMNDGSLWAGGTETVVTLAACVII